MIFGTGVVFLLDKLTTYFVIFQDLILMYVINCLDLIVVVFMVVNFEIWLALILICFAPLGVLV